MIGSEITFSKTEIRKIGNNIRINNFIPDRAVLLNLENYRKSYKEDIAKVYNRIYDLCHVIASDSIVTYRIKRIESIIGKLERFSEMKLDRMWDIAGCRCILKSNKQVFQLQESIIKEFDVVKINDYLKTPQHDGYRSIHLYIRCNTPKSNVIEIQLRNVEDHNWATLVEITDLIYDEKIKEKRSTSQLAEMHFLFSIRDSLSPKQKERIFQCLKKYDYINNLSDIFTRNYFSIRKQWLKIEGIEDNCFILIEASKNKTPKINVYYSFEEAEEQYYSLYDNNESTNRVLTHFTKPSYKKVSLAYSNYILTYHQFTNDCFKLLESLLIIYLIKRQYLKFKKYYYFYNYITASHIKNLKKEIKASNSEHNNLKAHEEWNEDIRDEISNREQKDHKFTKTLVSALKNKQISFLIIQSIVLSGKRYYERELESEEENQL